MIKIQNQMSYAKTVVAGCLSVPGKIFDSQQSPVFKKVQLHDTIYRLRFYTNSLIHVLSLSNLQCNVAPIQKNRGNKSHRVIVALLTHCCYGLDDT